MTLTSDEYFEAVEFYEGYCTTCKGFTTEGIEPDARLCICDACGTAAVYGAEQALLEGLIKLENLPT